MTDASFQQRRALKTMIAAALLLGAVGFANAQQSPSSTSVAPGSQASPAARDQSDPAAARQSARPGGAAERSGATTSAESQADKTRNVQGVPLGSRNDPARTADQAADARIGAPGSDLRNDRATARNDRTTMARAPRADRN